MLTMWPGGACERLFIRIGDKTECVEIAVAADKSVSLADLLSAIASLVRSEMRPIIEIIQD